MKCNCFSQEQKDKLMEHLRERNPGRTIENGDYLQTALQYVKNDLVLRSFIEFSYEEMRTKKDGSPGATRNRSVKIFHNFCPFCGVSQKTEDTGEEAAKS